jgi:hypothetical protein
MGFAKKSNTSVDTATKRRRKTLINRRSLASTAYSLYPTRATIICGNHTTHSSHKTFVCLNTQFRTCFSFTLQFTFRTYLLDSFTSKIIMVSQSSTRLMSGYRSSNNSCSSSSMASSKKRPASSNGKVDSFTGYSGYSADREETSAFPPLVSIDLHDGRRGSSDLNCSQKRRKKNELQFAALSAKSDLARAGRTYPTIDRNKEKTTSTNGSNINLKGMSLIHSQEFDMPTFSASSSAKNTFVDYELMVAACHDSYRHDILRPNTEENMMTPSPQDYNRRRRSRSTSLAIGTESEAGCSSTNGSSPVFLIPPLLEDSLRSSKTDPCKSSPLTSTCHIISSSATAVTMSDMLQLSTKAK